MAFHLGVNVVEVDGRAAPSIVKAPVSVAGFLVRSERGVTDLPVLVQGVADFTSYFGGYTADAFGAHAVRGFFDNGGSRAYVVRVTHAEDNDTSRVARAASCVVQDRAAPAQDTLEIAAGRQGRPDPGAWGNWLSVAISEHPRGSALVPAQVEGSRQEPFALQAGQGIAVTVNGADSPVEILFTEADFAAIGEATAAEVAALINRTTTSLRAGVTPDLRLLLSSNAPGTASRVAVADAATAGAGAALGFADDHADSDGALAVGATRALLQGTGGFSVGAAVRCETRGQVSADAPPAAALPDGAAIAVAVDGAEAQQIGFEAADFADGMDAVTLDGLVAAFNRRARGFSAGRTHDGHLVLMSDRYGPGSDIALAAPAEGVDATAALGLAAATPVAGARRYGELTAVSEANRLVTWDAGLDVALPVNALRVQTVEFDLAVRLDGVEVERFESLSMQGGLDHSLPTLVNDPQRGSRFIRVLDRGSASPAGENAPAPGSYPLGAESDRAGRDGADPVDMDYLGDASRRSGLHAFDGVAVQLLCCPETTATGVVSACLDYCERRGDLMFVGNPPRDYDLEEIKAYAADLRGRKIYGALYAPWIQVVNPLDTRGDDPRLWIPPSGHVLGVYARMADSRGVWKAPAGDAARVRGALGVQLDMTDTEHTDLVKNGAVNGIRALPGAGIVVDASRTLSSDTRWLYVNVRRLFNFVKASLRDGLRWVVQEPHSEELRRRVKYNVVMPFLQGLWRQGAFGSDPAEQVFSVLCDATNNPPEDVNQGLFRIEVSFYPVKPVETIVITVGQQDSGATAQEG